MKSVSSLSRLGTFLILALFGILLGLPLEKFFYLKAFSVFYEGQIFLKMTLLGPDTGKSVQCFDEILSLAFHPPCSYGEPLLFRIWSCGTRIE